MDLSTDTTLDIDDTSSSRLLLRSSGHETSNRYQQQASCNWKAPVVLVVFVVVSSGMLVVQYGFNRPGWPQIMEQIVKEETFMQMDTQRSRANKVILLWTPFFSSADYGFGVGRHAFASAGCAQTACETTTDKSRLSEADVLVFHMRNTQARDVPTRAAGRLAHQRYVFFLMESPDNTERDLRPFAGVFNWTMTYRRDSDVIINYFAIAHVNGTTTPSPGIRSAGSGRRLASWLVSNCHTDGHRELYVAELRRHLDVDVYGACGRPCPSSNNDLCRRQVFADYKFYLSFENSVCVDYVTEKMSNALRNDIVPVVYGGADYKAIAPPHSFVDVRDFDSPAQLAAFLKALDKNQSAYGAYLAWKSEYTVNAAGIMQRAFCDLCSKLHAEDDAQVVSNTTSRMTTSKVYNDIDRWWNRGGNCSHDVLGWPKYKK